VLPICLYPVLFWLMIQAALLVQGQREHTEVRVGLSAAEGVETPAGLPAALRRPPAAPGETSRSELDPVEVEELPPLPSRAAARALLEEDAGPETERPDALLHLGPPGDDEEPAATLLYDSTDSRSTLARRRVETRVESYAEELRRAAAERAQLDPEQLQPIEVETRNVAAGEEMGAYLLSFLLPILLVVMCVMGAFFPAVDLTAGERERGTAETTLLLPIPRLALHQGKILAVCAGAVLATSLNLLALGLSAGHLVNMITSGADIQVELPVLAFVAIAPLALLFAFSVSAVLTGIAALARTFKEGQALLGPVQLVFILPAMAGTMPGLALTPATACIPVVNVVLAFRTMLRGEALPLEFALTAVCLLLFAALSIWLAVRLLSREEIQTSGERVSLRRLVALLRSPAGSR
jgi:sodium transport system permease protein